MGSRIECKSEALVLGTTQNKIRGVFSDVVTVEIIQKELYYRQLRVMQIEDVTAKTVDGYAVYM